MQKFTILLAFLFFFSSACKNFLEVEPEFLFPEDIAIQSIKDLDQVATATFDAIQGGNLYGGGLVANSEFLADFIETEPISDFSLNQFRGRTLNSFNSQAGGLWADGYRAINFANILINKLPDYEDEDPELADIIRGEAHFIRGIIHFELVRMFAQPAGFTPGNTHPGIPIRTFPGTASEGNSEPRSSVSSVYTAVINDLNTAYNFLPDEKNRRANKNAAAAFLAKVYFQQNGFSEAFNWSDIVINSSDYELDTLSSAPFKLHGDEWGTEVIFQNINVQNDISNGDVGRFVGNAKALYQLRDNIGDKFAIMQSQGDERIGTVYINFLNLFWTTAKYGDREANLPVIRLAEMYLIRAECRARLQDSPELIRNDINAIRLRAHQAPDTTNTDFNVLLDIIEHERIVELAFEGDRFHDLKRRKKTINTPVGDFSWNDPRLVYPIPQGEIDANSNMVQNDGY